MTDEIVPISITIRIGECEEVIEGKVMIDEFEEGIKKISIIIKRLVGFDVLLKP